ncbi:MAG: hypothetical protein U9O89_02140 [Thermoproteota archaeon]|nr:hypothetical protein [Thermoproteota archaeon]
MKFPERVYTTEEVEKARRLVEKGYRHRLTVEGSTDFKQKVKKALNLVKTARYHDFLRTYIRSIVEIDGLSQLREGKAAIWANKYTVNDPVEAAGFLVQKAFQMKNFLEGKIYYGGEAEKRAVQKRIEFLQELKKSGNTRIKRRCEESLKRWTETIYF